MLFMNVEESSMCGDQFGVCLLNRHFSLSEREREKKTIKHIACGISYGKSRTPSFTYVYKWKWNVASLLLLFVVGDLLIKDARISWPQKCILKKKIIILDHIESLIVCP